MDLKDHIRFKKLYGVADDEYIQKLEALKYVVQRFCALYGSMSKPEKDAFVQKNLESIYKIYDAFYSNDTRKVLLTVQERDDIRTCIDIFYKRACGIQNVQEFFHQIPTRLFTSFIKGITHFANDTVYSRPSYHRSGSCGPKDSSHWSRFEIHSTDTKDVVQAKRSSLVRCYIDRLIYNDIYQRVLNEQDTSHRLELETLGRMANSFVDIRIMLRYEGIHPVRLSVLARLPNGQLWYREDYRKYADGRVLGIRADNIAFRKPAELRYRFKVQTYDHESPWSDDMPPQDQNLLESLIKSLPSPDRKGWSQPNAWAKASSQGMSAPTLRMQSAGAPKTHLGNR